MEDLLVKHRGKAALILGIGGGGDVVTAAVLRNFFTYFDVSARIGGVVWERISIDPVPGPVRLEELNPIKPDGESIGWVCGETVARRNGSLIKPQISRVSKLLGEECLAIDLWKAPPCVVRDLALVAEELGASLLVGVDVGGDVLATGSEEGLWSPLSDQVMLAVLSELESRGYGAVLAVHGLGADGELSVDYLLMRMSEVASSGGYLGARGLNSEDAELLEKLLEVTETESSAAPLEGFRGYYGRRGIRLGTREVEVSPLTSVTFFLDPVKVFENSPMAKALSSAKDLEEANQALNKMGVYTELDLERDVYEALSRGENVGKGEILEFKRRGLRRLRKETKA